MSGEVLLKHHAWWQVLPAMALSLAAAGGLTWMVISRLPLEGLAMAAVSALLAYALFRCLYPVFTGLLGGRKAVEPTPWTCTEDALVLGGDRIPRESIRMVHCWQDRDALGNRSAGWVVNIETTGRNRLLRSLDEGADAEQSVQQLRALVTALGYGSQWNEQ